MIAKVKKWYVYILRLADDTLYTGITTDPERRLHEHNHTPRGSKYVRSRRPAVIVYLENGHTKASASVREYAIKQLPKVKKEALVCEYENSAIDTA